MSTTYKFPYHMDLEDANNTVAVQTKIFVSSVKCYK